MSVSGEKIMSKRMLKLPKSERGLFNIINCFPQRSNIIPKHCTIDTTLLVNVLMKKRKRYYTMNIKKLCDEVWSMFFKTESKVFKKKGYIFNHQITTDGVSCTLLFIRKDLYNPLKTVKIMHMKKPSNYIDTKYVKDLTDCEKRKIDFKTIVGIDPGVDDLIYATNGDTKTVVRTNGLTKLKTTTFRYSRMQRRVETKSRKYANIIEKDKKTELIGGMNVKKIEDRLSKRNFNSCIFSNISNNIRLKNRINGQLFDYYEKNVYRQLKWFAYINRMRSEANMINRFKETFGKPEDVMIFIGDWSTQKNMRYKEPTKGKGFRDLFKKNGYKIYLVDEYNTSKKMNGSGDEMEKFKYIRKKKYNKTSKYSKKVEVHGLIRNKLTAGIPFIKTELMNRDLNGSLNIRDRGICEFYNSQIPVYLLRKNIVSGVYKKIIITKSKKTKKVQTIRKIVKIIKNVQVSNT